MAPQKEQEEPLLGAAEETKRQDPVSSSPPAAAAGLVGGANGTGSKKAHSDYVLLPVDGGEESKQQEGEKKEKESAPPPPPPVPFSRLFYFADGWDVLLMLVGSVAAAGTGTVMPLFSLIFSNTINAINVGPDDERRHNAAKYSLYFVGLAGISLVLNFVQSACFGVAAERQVRRMREKFLQSVLRQDIGWFDVSNSGELATRIKGDTLVVQQGIGEKLGLGIQFFATFVCGFCIGFSKGWKLALVMCSVVPLLGLSAAALFRSVGKFTTLGQSLYAEAGAVAEQAVASIRTVAAFTGEKKEADRYAAKLQRAQGVGVKSGTAIARGLACVLFIIFASYGLGMWFGAKEIADDHEGNPDCVYQGTCKINGGDVLVVFWSILFASMSIGQCGPQLSSVAEAKGAAAKLIEVCERTPAIDAESPEGKRLVGKQVEGRIEFRDVHFRYPSRPDAKIFEGFNLTVEPGQTVALVGSSGSGKSTIVGLLERFYNAEAGHILLDGVDIKDLNLKSLRAQLGLVSQEPTLFATSIAANIAYGAAAEGEKVAGKQKGGGEPLLGDLGVSRERIVEAAKSANAHDFITSFPDGYETEVGEMGVQLSGGQRQRIAIARAILKNPGILLLDEATSALDNESERVVQAALDRLVAARRRTTLIIAHRLSTIRNADVIVVLDKGRIVEQGRHEELMAIPEGHYRSLVALQTLPGAGSGSGSNGMPRSASTASMGSKERENEEELLPIISPKPHYTRNSSHGPPGTATTPSSSSLAAVAVKKPGAEEDGAGGKPPQQVDSRRIWGLSRPEAKWVALAVVMAVVNGCTFPAYSFFLSNIVSYLYDPDPSVVRTKAYFWAGMFPLLACVVAAATFTQLLAFTVMGERLTTRLRDLAFRNIVRQDIAYFDREENSTGAITTRLATEVTLVKNVTGQNLGRSVQNVVTVAAAFTIAFVFGSLKMALVLLGVLPLMVLGSFAQMRALRQNTDKSQESIAQAGSVAVQAITGIRTVTAFGMSPKLLALYSAALRKPMLLGIRNALLRGLTLGLSQFVSLAAYGGLFYLGSHLVLAAAPEERGRAFQRMLRSLMAVTMSAQGIGQNTSFLGDQAAANSAAARIFAVVDRRPAIDSTGEGGEVLDRVEGRIEFRKVNFTYPARPEQPIFRRFSLTVEPGTTVALVGASGSGKSTVVSLVERFYDPDEGQVLLDGKDLKELNVHWLRSQIGLVSQEPILFASANIAENIAYGVPNATREQVVAAAKAANAHAFITSFPDGYETEVGDRGVALSGGQKQRIALARAILKDPAILLLDEATSALDSESEAVVQAALDELMAAKKRTTIVVAHRLSTIRNADLICVVFNGRIVEQGTHEELIARPDSQYSMLCRMSG